jgi:hypothetical protein
MQAQSNPFQVVINPPGIQSGMQGHTIEIYVIVTNRGDRGAVIDLFFAFDEAFQKITGWTNSPRESRAIASQESTDEVVFELEIPVDALAGTYDYTLVVDSPKHYPQDTPINFPRQLKILAKEHTVIRASDPTFLIQPTTNPDKPLILKADEPLQVEVIVENRSDRVDRFRLSCPDIDEDWFTITYPRTGFEGSGLTEVNALELNDHSQGQILLRFNPPGDTLSGSYSPTIRLHSENHPDLVLLDLVYIQIPPDYRLNVKLNTITGKVRGNPGKYELSLNNFGNVVREFIFSGQTQDEEDFCTYKFEPRELKLLPSKTAEANLTVKPRRWWHRPWFGAPLIINFQVNIADKQNLPLPDTLPEGTLVWKPRPWWQFLLLILLILGLLGGIGYIIWRTLNPEPLKVEGFIADSRTITEGDEVRLNWKIHNYKQLRSLVVTSKEPIRNEPLLNYKNQSELINKNKKNQSPVCQVIPQEALLICNRVKTGVKEKGKHVFEIKAVYSKDIANFSRRTQEAVQTTDVEISEKPIAEVLDFRTDKPQYKKGENIFFSWIITNPQLLAQLQIVGEADDRTAAGQPITYKFNQGVINDLKLQKLCQEKNQQLICTKIPYSISQVGNFLYKLKAIPNNGSSRISEKPTETKIQISPKPFRIVFFKINGKDPKEQPILILNEGDTATLTWKVEGDPKEIKVTLFGNEVTLTGSNKIPVVLNFPSPIQLKVTDKSGKLPSQEIVFPSISVNKKIEPTPTFVVPPVAPAINPNPTQLPRLPDSSRNR